MKIAKCKIIGFASVIALVGCGKVLPTQESPEQANQSGLELNTTVSGLGAQDGRIQRSAVELQFSVTGKDSTSQDLRQEGYECRLGKEDKYVPCNGAPFTISGLKDGSAYHFEVRGLVRQLSTSKLLAAKESVNEFKVDLTKGDATQQSPALTGSAISHYLQVGSFYRVDVPQGMHVTEYSTSKTTGVLSYFRVINEADPFYLGNYSCANGWDRVVAAMSPAGAPLMYCHSTPTREAYKTENEFRLAHNHVEVATDTELVTVENQERLSISSFDQDYELVNVRSRFLNDCQGAAQGTHVIEVPMINNFFLGSNPEKVKFHWCDRDMPDMDGTPRTWRIGAFYDNDSVDWNNPNYKTNRAIEAVYMVRANASIFRAEQFARHAQERILDVLKKIDP